MVMCILANPLSGDDPAIQADPPPMYPGGRYFIPLSVEATVPDLLPIPHTSEALNQFSSLGVTYVLP